MGSVYRGVQLGTRGRVAVKLLSKQAPDDTIISRFRQEAEMTARLTHPNTVRLLDFGVDDSLLFLVTEYLAGTDLTRFLRAGGQPDNFLVHILFQIVGSLAEAHSKGVIHRDIKPNNVMLVHHVGWPSFVKVIDFGIARAIGGPGHGTKGLLGTLGYIAPEQTEQNRLPDVRSDLYALGCLAYELSTGRLPFHGITHQSAPLDILEAHLGGTPTPIFEHRPNIAPALGQLIMRLLSRDPTQRPNSAGELILPLNELRVRFLREGPSNRLAGIAPAEPSKDILGQKTAVDESSGFLNTADDTEKEGTLTIDD